MPAELKPTSLRSDHGRWPLIIFVAALIVRVANVLFLSANDPAFYYPQVDSQWHHLWAIDILKNNFGGSEVYFRGPLYPYFLALVYAIFGVSTFAAKLVQAVGGAAICLLIYQLGRTAVSEKTGRIAALIAVFYGPLLFYESELLIEWLAILLALLMLLVLLKNRSQLTIRTVFLAGICGGLSAIARPNILIVYPLIALWIVWENRTSHSLRSRLLSAGAFTLGIVLCILPVTVRNYVVGDDLVLISSQGGVNFHLANNSQANGLTMVMPEIRLNLSVPWSDFVDTTSAFAESALGHKLKPSEVSSFWSSRAWDYIGKNPMQFLSLTGKRLIYLFSGFENSDQADIYRFSDFSPVLKALIWNHGVKFPFGIIGPLSLIGLVMAWRERSRLSLLYLFLLGYIPTVILFLVTARHRLAIIVILFIFAGYAIERLIATIRKADYRRLAMPFASLLILFLLLNHNWFDLGFDNPAQFHYQRGMVLEKQGNLPGAIAAYREALTFQPLPEAMNNLGYALWRSGDLAGAYDIYHRALVARPDYADAMSNLGLLFLNGGPVDSARYYFERARQLDPGLGQVYLNLSEIYLRSNNAAAADSILQLGIQYAPKLPSLYNALANIYLKQGRIPEAKSLLEKSLLVDDNYATGHVNLANIQLGERNFESAREHYRRALAIKPDLKQAQMNLAILFVQANMPDSARVCFEAVLKIDPTDRQAQEALLRLRH